ncbi:hypothetical protein DFH94DRAFT_357106 [Russula ochroleuca]|uniref:Uncharacterized protein n=1 Tax=Russula ochroleuca TaxID=152965 RepID=A0A9P5JW00_9AGAM|nr:hypothetical protein DFH94DRAFT_357106 [Russula ochroleuca]
MLAQPALEASIRFNTTRSGTGAPPPGRDGRERPKMGTLNRTQGLIDLRSLARIAPSTSCSWTTTTTTTITTTQQQQQQQQQRLCGPRAPKIKTKQVPLVAPSTSKLRRLPRNLVLCYCILRLSTSALKLRNRPYFIATSSLCSGACALLPCHWQWGPSFGVDRSPSRVFIKFSLLTLSNLSPGPCAAGPKQQKKSSQIVRARAAPPPPPPTLSRAA